MKKQELKQKLSELELSLDDHMFPKQVMVASVEGMYFSATKEGVNRSFDYRNHSPASGAAEKLKKGEKIVREFFELPNAKAPFSSH